MEVKHITIESVLLEKNRAAHRHINSQAVFMIPIASSKCLENISRVVPLLRDKNPKFAVIRFLCMLQSVYL